MAPMRRRAGRGLRCMTGAGMRADGEASAWGAPSRRGTHPYSTGGGGVTLERRVAARYLAMLLTRESAEELGKGRVIVSVAFQQAPRHPVDDLVIRAAYPDETEPSLKWCVGVRRVPQVREGHEKTRKLIAEYVRTLLRFPVSADGCEHWLALVVSGSRGA